MVAVSRPSTSPQRSRRMRRLVPLLVLAAGAFAGGVIAGARHEPSERRLANRFAQAWEREQYADMYAMLTPRARSETSLRRVRARVPPGGARRRRSAALTAGRAGDPVDDTVTVPMTASTRIFGDFEAAGHAAAGRGRGRRAGDRVGAAPGLPRPAPRRGAHPRDAACPRAGRSAPATARAMAYGEDRLSDLDPEASEIAGRVGPAPPERADELAARGVPEGAPVGISGLEREFDAELAGTPGRRAAGRHARAGQRRAGAREQRPHHDRSRDPARGGPGAGRPLRRDRGRPPAHRRGARAGRRRLLGPAAAGLGVQDRHADRRRSRRGRSAATRASRSRRRRRSRASSSRTPTASRAAGR